MDAVAYQTLITVTVPVIVNVVRNYLPKIPKVAIPLLAVALAIGADALVKQTGAVSGPWWEGAVLGGLSIALREISNQCLKFVGAIPQNSAPVDALPELPKLPPTPPAPPA